MLWWKGLGPLIKLGIYAAILAVVMGSVTAAYFSWRHTQRMVGWNNALAAVAEQNARASAAAEKVRHDVRGCFNSGGTWNVSTGNCDR